MKKLVILLLLCAIFLNGCTVFRLNTAISAPAPDKEQDTPSDPDTPDTPDISVNPDIPDEPTVPDIPDIPDIPDEPIVPDEPENKNKVIKIVAAGDNLLHNTISFDARQSDGTFDFSPIYTRVAPIISGAHLSYINQEIMLTGGISGYPHMEAPYEAADGLLSAGFNIVNIASNHSFDKGIDGFVKCIKGLKERPFDAVLGGFETEEESNKLILVEKEGITFGFLSYTYGSNIYPLTDDNSYMLPIYDQPKMVADLKRIRPMCDYLIVSMHWGAEYKFEPTNYQRTLGQLLCDNGADLIIGTHPHVLQPLETLTSANGRHKTLCAWSLGNFISNQHRLETMLGGLLQVELTFDEEKQVVSTRASIIPTVTHYDDDAKNYKVYKLSDYTQALADTHGIRQHAESPLSMEFLEKLAKDLLKENMTNEVY